MIEPRSFHCPAPIFASYHQFVREQIECRPPGPFRSFSYCFDLTSAELRDYQDSLPGSDVTVELEVTTRLGYLERIKAVRIGEHTESTHEWGGSGWVDHEKPSPWDEFHCLIPWW